MMSMLCHCGFGMHDACYKRKLGDEFAFLIYTSVAFRLLYSGIQACVVKITKAAEH